MPHMHLRGISARYELTRPDGTTETLLAVPDYDFGWQSVYRFAEPLKVAKGSKLTWTAHWDNSAENPQSRLDQGGSLGIANLGRNAERLDGGGVEDSQAISASDRRGA